MRTFLAILALLTALSFAVPARAADTDRPSISTTGEATVYVVPDKVIVNLCVETHDSNLDKAKASNEANATKLVKALEDLGIEKTNIATDNLQVVINYRYNDGWQDITGYTVRRGYAVTLKDVKLFEKLIDTALKNGANQIQDVAFQTTELRKYRDQARQMAVKAAKEKAVALAKELDCTVGKPRQIIEGGGYSYFGGFRWGGRSSSMSQNAVQSVAGPADTGENLPLGQIAVTASVSVTFEMN